MPLRWPCSEIQSLGVRPQDLVHGDGPTRLWQAVGEAVAGREREEVVELRVRQLGGGQEGPYVARLDVGRAGLVDAKGLLGADEARTRRIGGQDGATEKGPQLQGAGKPKVAGALCYFMLLQTHQSQCNKSLTLRPVFASKTFLL